MIAELQPDVRVSPHIYELVGSHNLGTPIKRHQRKFVQIFFFVLLAFLLCIVGWMCYDIYAAIAFIILSHIYPHIDNVPSDQWSNYFWLQAIHDNFWFNMLQLAAPLLSILSAFLSFYHAYRTKLYLCTDGLLKIYRKKIEAARWDEVQDFYMNTNGFVTRLVKSDSSSLEIPSLLLGGSSKQVNTLISDELTRHLLPGALASYVRGETLRFGLLKVSEQGIYRSGVLVVWDRIGDVILQGGHVSAFYATKLYGYRNNDRLSRTDKPKWHSLQKSGAMGLTYPNLPVFVVLANIILARRDFEQAQVQGTTASEVKQIRKDASALARRRNKRRVKIVVISSLMGILCVITLISFLIAYPLIQQQARADHDLQLLRQYFTTLAHKPYYAPVPGHQCDRGKGTWNDDNTSGTFACRPDGLVMRQTSTQYQLETYFAFDPDTPGETVYAGHYISHHYRVQVKAAFLSGGPGACAAIHVHVQDFTGRQEFDVCADGSWDYSRCDLQCDNDVQVASGNLPQATDSYLIGVDVTDNVLTLFVDNKKITVMQDNTYSSTDEIVLGLYGNFNYGQPIVAKFADFLYTPLV